MAETEDPKHQTKRHRFGGPHGLGDPDDRSLRKVESDILIPKLVRERSRNEKCVEAVKAFKECCADSKVLMIVKCRKENSALKECLSHWFSDAELNAECKEQYLATRSEYRRTGIGRASDSSPLGKKRMQSSM